jgi:hypothetical protein
VLVAALALAARAGDDPGSEGAPAAAHDQKRVDALFLGMNRFVGDTKLDEKGVLSVLKHWESFDAIGGKGEDDLMRKAIEATYEKTGAYDFGVLLRHPEVRKWVAKTGVDAKTWIRQSMRASMLIMRADLLRNVTKAKEQAKRQFAELETMKVHLGEEKYTQIRQRLERSLAAANGLGKAAKTIPEPELHERTLLEEYGKKLRALFGEDEEEAADDPGPADDEQDEDEGDEEDEAEDDG